MFGKILSRLWKWLNERMKEKKMRRKKRKKLERNFLMYFMKEMHKSANSFFNQFSIFNFNKFVIANRLFKLDPMFVNISNA